MGEALTALAATGGALGVLSFVPFAPAVVEVAVTGMLPPLTIFQRAGKVDGLCKVTLFSITFLINIFSKFIELAPSVMDGTSAMQDIGKFNGLGLFSTVHIRQSFKIPFESAGGTAYRTTSPISPGCKDKLSAPKKNDGKEYGHSS
jgi:hypothetical protein